MVVIDTPPPDALYAAEMAIKTADQIVMPVPPEAAGLDRVASTPALAVGLIMSRNGRFPYTGDDRRPGQDHR